ncbi:acyl-CoA N-acyltransferase [Cercophora newfieldiana]|uniref:Acyl-CoA N-acyltransferase n=1 Tax=Cercophora newfieldiana TaxID=92897 RepID=A0AA39Y0K1_9PEZI|nr:acyl-CoA N-acyltransferase [Cercophora newfieldiana]
MSYRLMSVTVEDGKDIARNNTTAFWTDPSWRLGWTIPLETLIRHNELRGPANLLRDREIKRYQKAVDEDGNLVGYVRFRLPEGDKWRDAWPEARVPDVSDEERKRIDELFAEGTKDYEAGIRDLSIVDEPMSAMHHKLREARKGHMEIEFLAVHPDHRNKGIANRLVRKGIEIADQLGLDMYVLALEGGYKIYKGCGFQVLEHLELDDSVYGGAGVFHRYYLERKAVGGPVVGKDDGPGLPIETV